jgi:RNA polymerase sigma factor (sigma-70 family)
MRVTEEHVAQAVKIAHWYGRRRARRAEISDLESAALEGLAKAARDFDPKPAREKRRQVHIGRSFWTFAFRRIVGEMKDDLRRLDHLTRDQRALVVEDEAGQLFVDQNDLSWMNPHEPLPLDASVSPETEGAPPIKDMLEEPRNPIEDLELRDAFCRATARLSERERLVLFKRELEGYSNAELARAFEVTEGRASQLRTAALEQLRRELRDSFLDAA